MSETHSSLSGIELFAGLGPGELDVLATTSRWRNYAPGQQIVGHQDDTNDVCFIVDGRVRVTVYSRAGKEVAFRDLGAGKSFGELSALDGGRRSANVIALADSLIASLPAPTFKKVLSDHPEIAARVMAYLTGLVRKLSDRVVEFSVLAVKNRIHAELLRLVRERGVEGSTAILSPAPTHADIASRVSTHREAVTRELNALAQDGLVARRDGVLVIHDVLRLKELVERVLEE